MSNAKVFGNDNITIAFSSDHNISIYYGQKKIDFISRVVLDTSKTPAFEVYFPRSGDPDTELQIESYVRILSTSPMIKIIRI